MDDWLLDHGRDFHAVAPGFRARIILPGEVLDPVVAQAPKPIDATSRCLQAARGGFSMGSTMKKIAYLFLAMLGAAASTPASAATVSGTYFEESASVDCSSNVFNCVIRFAQLPSTLTGKLLTITEISCTVYAAQVLLQGYMYVTDAGSNLRRQHAFAVARASGYSSLVEPVNFKITGGPPRQLFVYLHQEPVGTMFAECTVVGSISDQ